MSQFAAHGLQVHTDHTIARARGGYVSTRAGLAAARRGGLGRDVTDYTSRFVTRGDRTGTRFASTRARCCAGARSRTLGSRGRSARSLGSSSAASSRRSGAR